MSYLHLFVQCQRVPGGKALFSPRAPWIQPQPQRPRRTLALRLARAPCGTLGLLFMGKLATSPLSKDETDETDGCHDAIY